MNSGLAGRVIVVTGGAAGIGAAIATVLILYGGDALLFYPAAAGHGYGLFLIAPFFLSIRLPTIVAFGWRAGGGPVATPWLEMPA